LLAFNSRLHRFFSHPSGQVTGSGTQMDNMVLVKKKDKFSKPMKKKIASLIWMKYDLIFLNEKSKLFFWIPFF